jgi:hypothetical protein
MAGKRYLAASVLNAHRWGVRQAVLEETRRTVQRPPSTSSSNSAWLSYG